MKVTEKDLADVAILSRLSIAEGERDKYLGQLDAFLQYVENLDGRGSADDVCPADAECLSCRRGEAFARTRGGAFQCAFGGRRVFQSAEDSGRLRRNLGETLRQGGA